MSDVFISYKRERRIHAERLAAVLEAHGFEVFWDYQPVVGPSYTKQLLHELTNAKAVIVLWCSGSIASSWVIDEATRARVANKLVPAQIEFVDPPLGFGGDQIASLVHWKGDPTAEMLTPLLSSVAALVGRGVKPAPNLMRILKLVGELPFVEPMVVDSEKDTNRPPVAGSAQRESLDSEGPEALFEQAMSIAENYYTITLDAAGDLADYVAVAMIEVAVNHSIGVAGHADIIDVLRDLADQIEQDMLSEASTTRSG